MRKPLPETTDFPGFQREYKKNYFKYPIILQRYWPMLSGDEQKVLDYILRRTSGFQKISDDISLSQIAYGAGEKNWGVGISKSQAKRCLESLEKKGFIVLSKHGGATTTIQLRLESEQEIVSAVSIVIADTEATRLIKLFAPVAQHRTEEFLTDRRQIAAIEKLLAYHKTEQVESAIRILPQIHGQPYMPTIASPVELESKWSKLVAAVKRINAKHESEHGLIAL